MSKRSQLPTLLAAIFLFGLPVSCYAQPEPVVLSKDRRGFELAPSGKRFYKREY
jgi:hypothetical protein